MKVVVLLSRGLAGLHQVCINTRLLFLSGVPWGNLPSILQCFTITGLSDRNLSKKITYYRCSTSEASGTFGNNKEDLRTASLSQSCRFLVSHFGGIFAVSCSKIIGTFIENFNRISHRVLNGGNFRWLNGS